jgi:hypothetical protein
MNRPPPWLHTAFATEAEALNFSRAKVLHSPHHALVSTAEVKLLLQENLTLVPIFDLRILDKAGGEPGGEK